MDGEDALVGLRLLRDDAVVGPHLRLRCPAATAAAGVLRLRVGRRCGWVLGVGRERNERRGQRERCCVDAHVGLLLKRMSAYSTGCSGLLQRLVDTVTR